MKQVLKYSWMMIGLAFLLQACESSMPVFTESECEILFDSASVPVKKTFVYDEPGTETGIVYIPVRAVGFVKDYDRPFVVRQVDAKDVVNAVPGTHFQVFGEQQFVMPAGKSKTYIPITIINDASLGNEQFVLCLELGTNKYFKASIEEDLHKNIEITNLLTKPESWADWYFGTYGPVKHQFLIDISGEKWDDEFCRKVNSNYNLVLFWKTKGNQEVALENERRAAEGKGPLREAPLPGEEEGILVGF